MFSTVGESAHSCRSEFDFCHPHRQRRVEICVKFVHVVDSKCGKILEFGSGPNFDIIQFTIGDRSAFIYLHYTEWAANRIFGQAPKKHRKILASSE